MPKTFGELLHRPGEGRKRGVWGVRAAPHVMIRLKRLFPRVETERTGLAVLVDTPEITRDLEWFCERYPLDMDDIVAATLRRGAEFQRRTEQLVLDITAGTERPDYGWRETAVPSRDYQIAPADIVHATGRLLLVDQLGLGKTHSSLRVLRSPEALPALVVCPTHLPGQWLAEMNRTLPWLNGHVVTSGTPYRPEEKRASKGVKPEVLFISYSKLRGWADTLATGEYRTVIFDEAQELRTGEMSDKGKAAARIADAAEFRMGLTGTPIYNYADEIWHLLNVIAPDVLGALDEFRREWGGDTRDRRIKVRDPEALGSYLRDQGVFLRRTRAEVGRELPELINVEQHVDTDQAVLDQLTGDAIDVARLVLSADPKQRFTATGELDWRMRHATGVAKAPYVAEFVKLLLEQEERVVLFGWHRDVYGEWLGRLTRYAPTLYTGSESPERKRQSVQAFTEGRSRVLCISLRSGAGLDGLQDVCKVAVFGELDWSPGVHEQCAGRLHRDGQTDPVVAYYMVSDGGSDPIMREVLGIKSQQSRQVVSPEDPLVAPSGGESNAARVRQMAVELLRRRGVEVPGGEATG